MGRVTFMAPPIWQFSIVTGVACSRNCGKKLVGSLCGCIFDKHWSPAFVYIRVRCFPFLFCCSPNKTTTKYLNSVSLSLSSWVVNRFYGAVLQLPTKWVAVFFMTLVLQLQGRKQEKLLFGGSWEAKGIFPPVSVLEMWWKDRSHQPGQLLQASFVKQETCGAKNLAQFFGSSKEISWLIPDRFPGKSVKRWHCKWKDQLLDWDMSINIASYIYQHDFLHKAEDPLLGKKLATSGFSLPPLIFFVLTLIYS